MKKYCWAHTAHKMTEEQQECLVGMFSVKLPSDLAEKLSSNYAGQDLIKLANELIKWARENKIDYLIQPSGSLAFQMALGKELFKIDYNHETYQEWYVNDLNIRNSSLKGAKLTEVYYSYSERISEDIPQEDGTIKKVSTFKFEGFYTISGKKLPVGVVL